MPDPHVQPEQLLAGAAAGDLTPVEQDTLDRHLAGCAACRAELDELDAVVAALRTDPAEGTTVTPLAAPPPALGDRVVRAVRDTRQADRRRRRSTAVVAAAAAAVALLAAGSLLPDLLDPPPSREPVQLAAAVDGVESSAALVTHSWGTELLLEVEGLPAGVTYSVAFVDDEGRRFDAGAFLGVERGPVLCEMNAALPRDSAARLEITARDEVVLAAEV